MAARCGSDGAEWEGCVDTSSHSLIVAECVGNYTDIETQKETFITDDCFDWIETYGCTTVVEDEPVKCPCAVHNHNDDGYQVLPCAFEHFDTTMVEGSDRDLNIAATVAIAGMMTFRIFYEVFKWYERTGEYHDD